jgi:hypothetical protein
MIGPLGPHTPQPKKDPEPGRVLSEIEWCRYLGFVDPEGKLQIAAFRAATSPPRGEP